MVIFHRYVSLPEGRKIESFRSQHPEEECTSSTLASSCGIRGMIIYRKRHVEPRFNGTQTIQVGVEV
jgi:hypothetical protein